MARQIVRESFYVYCNRFREFIPFGCISAVLYFTLSYFSTLFFLLAPLLIITCEIPCYSLFCNKSPVHALRENPKTILFFVVCYIVVVSASRYASSLPQQIMSSEVELFLVNLLLNVIFTFLQVSVAFLLIYSIKKNCGAKDAFSKYADVFSSNRAWKIWLYLKICLVEFGCVLLLLIAVLAIPFFVLPLLPFSENLTTIVMTLFVSISFGTFYPYISIRMCNYCEEIC